MLLTAERFYVIMQVSGFRLLEMIAMPVAFSFFLYAFLFRFHSDFCISNVFFMRKLAVCILSGFCFILTYDPVYEVQLVGTAGVYILVAFYVFLVRRYKQWQVATCIVEGDTEDFELLGKKDGWYGYKYADDLYITRKMLPNSLRALRLRCEEANQVYIVSYIGLTNELIFPSMVCAGVSLTVQIFSAFMLFAQPLLYRHWGDGVVYPLWYEVYIISFVMNGLYLVKHLLRRCLIPIQIIYACFFYFCYGLYFIFPFIQSNISA